MWSLVLLENVWENSTAIFLRWQFKAQQASINSAIKSHLLCHFCSKSPLKHVMCLLMRKFAYLIPCDIYLWGSLKYSVQNESPYGEELKNIHKQIFEIMKLFAPTTSCLNDIQNVCVCVYRNGVFSTSYNLQELFLLFLWGYSGLTWKLTGSTQQPR